tara:strand:- start:73 stop:312 length:240 start_codon:yes stop_codon:yes gene_type:complete
VSAGGGDVGGDLAAQFAAQPAGQPQPPHPEIRAQAPQRIGEGGGAVPLDREMHQPGEGIAGHRHGEQQTSSTVHWQRNA